MVTRQYFCGRRVKQIEIRFPRRAWISCRLLNATGMTWKMRASRLWPLVLSKLPDQSGDRANGGRPPIPDQFVFEKLVLFLRSGCSWGTFDELCRSSGISGRTCRRRFAL